MSSDLIAVLSSTLVALATLGLLLWIARRRLTALRARSAREAPARSAAAGPLILLGKPRPTRFPLVFAHGYFGFDAIPVARIRYEYFRGVRQRLGTLGYSVHMARVSPAAGIELRAGQLARQLYALPASRVNVIAHSMGGLDARYAITHLGLAPRVASLITIGTPHHGTPLADSALRLGDLGLLRRLLKDLGANVDGLYDLTTPKMKQFNQLVRDHDEVLYASIVGAMRPEAAGANLLLAAGHAYLARAAGPNDGIVPAASQRWGEVLREVEADHWAQIGWSLSFDAPGFYVNLAEELAARGL